MWVNRVLNYCKWWYLEFRSFMKYILMKWGFCEDLYLWKLEENYLHDSIRFLQILEIWQFLSTNNVELESWNLTQICSLSIQTFVLNFNYNWLMIQIFSDFHLKEENEKSSNSPQWKYKYFGTHQNEFSSNSRIVGIEIRQKKTIPTFQTFINT